MKKRGFTLIELLVVIAIIGIIATMILLRLSTARKKARDARRLSDVKQIQTALELYFDTYNRYPTHDASGCAGWDTGNQLYPLLDGRMTDINEKPLPVDPTGKVACSGYDYYRYGAGQSGCDVTKGAYYVLGVLDMESSGRPHPDSPGFSCPNRNWQNGFDWVTGEFEGNH